MAQLSLSQIQANRKGSLCGLTGSSRQCPLLAEEAVLSWWRLQDQVPRLSPAVITEGARYQGPSWPSGFSLNWRQSFVWDQQEYLL